MKQKNNKRENQDKDLTIAKAKLDNLLVKIEAGMQSVTALEEITHLLNRMIDLQEAGLGDTEEFRQLKQRYEFLNDYNEQQQTLFNLFDK
ncbi:MAG: hypothetical protein PUG12_08205 [Prevotella sp.]|nr:hypothetical protein [Prevotella sp.]